MLFYAVYVCGGMDTAVGLMPVKYVRHFQLQFPLKTTFMSVGVHRCLCVCVCVSV